MKNKYFQLARTEEKLGHDCAALLLYLSSFCDSCNHGTMNRFYGVVSKIRQLQHRLMLTDLQLLRLLHSYGPLTDSECRTLLACSIRGTEIHSSTYEYSWRKSWNN